jgi:plastocyanin
MLDRFAADLNEPDASTVERAVTKFSSRGGEMRRVGILLAAITVALAVSIGAASGSGHSVTASNYHFTAKTITVHKGDKVTWTSVGGKHSVTFTNGSLNHVIKKGHSTSKKFQQTGTFHYYCRFHRDLGMKGKVVVQG